MKKITRKNFLYVFEQVSNFLEKYNNENWRVWGSTNQYGEHMMIINLEDKGMAYYFYEGDNFDDSFIGRLTLKSGYNIDRILDFMETYAVYYPDKKENPKEYEIFGINGVRDFR